MKKEKLLLTALVVVLVVVSIQYCSHSPRKPQLSSIDIPKIFPQKTDIQKPDQLVIYVDISRSMANYASTGESNYAKLFRALDVKSRAAFLEKVTVKVFGNRIAETLTPLLRFSNPKERGLIYTETATRLDLVIDEIQRTVQKKLFIIITDAEAESPGGFKENPLVGNLSSKFTSLLDSDLTIKIIGIKSSWGGTISRPFYLMLIGNHRAVQECTFFDNIPEVSMESVTFAKSFLKSRQFSAEFLDDESPGVILLNQPVDCFEMIPQTSHKFSIGMNIKYFSDNSLVKLDPSWICSTSLSVRTVVENDEGNLVTQNTNELQLKGIQVKHINMNTFNIKFDMMPFAWKNRAYALNLKCYTDRKSLTLSLPDWLQRWSTDKPNDFSKTYLFYDLLAAVIDQGLLERHPYEIASIYFLF